MLGLFRNRKLQREAEEVINRHKRMVPVFGYRANEDGSVSKVLIGKFPDRDSAYQSVKHTVQMDSTLIGWSW